MSNSGEIGPKLRTKFIDTEGFEPLTHESLIRRLSSKKRHVAVGHARLFIEALMADQSEDDGVARYLLSEFATDIGIGGPQDVGDLLALPYQSREDGHSAIVWDPRDDGGWFIGSLGDILRARKRLERSGDQKR